MKQQHIIKCEKEKLDVAEEIAKAEAREAVYAEVELSEKDDHDTTEDKEPDDHVDPTAPTPPNPDGQADFTLDQGSTTDQQPAQQHQAAFVPTSSSQDNTPMGAADGTPSHHIQPIQQQTPDERDILNGPTR